MTRSDQACLPSLPIGRAGRTHVQPYAVCDIKRWGVDGLKEGAGVFPAECSALASCVQPGLRDALAG